MQTKVLRESLAAIRRAGLTRLARHARSFGPYLLIELLLPGGTLVALLLWLTQHGRLPLRQTLRAADNPQAVSALAP